MSEGIAYEKFIKVYRKSDVIFEENSSGNEMFIVYSGRVKLYTQPKTGRRTVLSVLRPGEHFGEMALIDGSPRSATAVAVQDNTKLVVLDKAKFLYLVQQQPEFAFAMMETLSQRIREANLQLAQARVKRQRG
jgi:CRP/FNR family cyclic AMP-dependent transcriptional regulator